MPEPLGEQATNARRLKALAARCFVATLLTSAIGGTWDGIQVIYNPNGEFPPPILEGFGAFLFILPFTLAGLLLLGLPYAYALMRLRAENALTYGLGGAALGVMWTYVLMRPLNPETVAFGAVLGVVCALSWCWFQPRTLLWWWRES